VSGVVSVQGLDQEGECGSRISVFSSLSTNSRLGVLKLCVFHYWLCLCILFSDLNLCGLVLVWYAL